MKSFTRHPLNLPYAETYSYSVFTIMLTDICFIKISFYIALATQSPFKPCTPDNTKTFQEALI